MPSISDHNAKIIVTPNVAIESQIAKLGIVDRSCDSKSPDCLMGNNEELVPKYCNAYIGDLIAASLCIGVGTTCLPQQHQCCGDIAYLNVAAM